MKRLLILNLILLTLILSQLFTGNQASAQIDDGSDKAMVIIDPADKHNIKGYVHIAFAWGDQLSPPKNLLRGIINLKEAVIRWTDIDTVIDNHLYLGQSRLMKMPFVYVTTDKAFQLSGTERKNVKTYLENGGFMVLENATPRYEASQAGASLKQMLRDALGSNIRFRPIRNSHPLYHCYFDFDDGPPIGSEIGTVNLAESSPTSRAPATTVMSKRVLYLEGVWIGDRLVAVYSDKGYIVRWNDNLNNEPQLRMGVNMVIFALTQSGGIVQRK